MSMLLCAAAIFGLVAFIHELGHFVAAKLVGIRVLTFSIGFGPKLWSKRVGETVYRIGTIPLGGYVRPFAALDDSDAEGVEVSGRRLMRLLTPSETVEIDNFSSLNVDDAGNLLRKSAWSRFFFLAAGAGFNLISVFILSFVYFSVRPQLVPSKELRIGNVAKNSAAEVAGVKPGDLIVAVDGSEVQTWSGVRDKFQGSSGREILMSLERREDLVGKGLTIKITPKEMSEHGTNAFARVYSTGISGTFVQERMGVSMAARNAADILWSTMSSVTGSLFGVTEQEAEKPNRDENFEESEFGVVTNFLEVGYHASQSVTHFLSFFCALSVIIALVNLIPLPALDGGQIVVLILQKVSCLS